MERAERAAAVRDAVAALPAELREALVLFEYEELAQAEIAATLGCTVKAVESRLARAGEVARGVARVALNLRSALCALGGLFISRPRFSRLRGASGRVGET